MSAGRRGILLVLGLLLTRAAEAMTCVGADTMQDLTAAWAAPFGAQVTVDRSTKLSAEGFDRLIAGQADCVTYVREPFASELAAYRDKFKTEPFLLPVAGGSYDTKSGTHAIAVYVNKTNPLSNLTIIQLKTLFGSKTITRWGQLGLTGEWADRPIHVYGMLRQRGTGNPPGIVNFLQQRVLAGGQFRDDLREQTGDALQEITNRIAEDPDGIGFSGFGFAQPGVKTLALAEMAQGPFYQGTKDEVANRVYPLSRSIYLMVKPEQGGKLSPLQYQFLAGALSAEGQRAVAADKMGFLPLTPNLRAESRAKLEQWRTP